MTVSLTVVGIFYFNGSIDISSLTPDGNGNYSVQQIMDQATTGQGDNGGVLSYAYGTASSSNSVYGDVSGSNYVDFIAATYSSEFNSFSGNSYPAGTYGLSQTATNFAAPHYSVWQYYVFNASGLPITLGETPFTVSTATVNGQSVGVVNDNYSIVWRLVTIASGPVVLNPRVKSIMGGLPSV